MRWECGWRVESTQLYKARIAEDRLSTHTRTQEQQEGRARTRRNKPIKTEDRRRYFQSLGEEDFVQFLVQEGGVHPTEIALCSLAAVHTTAFYELGFSASVRSVFGHFDFGARFLDIRLRCSVFGHSSSVCSVFGQSISVRIGGPWSSFIYILYFTILDPGLPRRLGHAIWYR